MKKNWWKVLILVLLAVAIVAVVVGKNRERNEVCEAKPEAATSETSVCSGDVCPSPVEPAPKRDARVEPTPPDSAKDAAGKPSAAAQPKPASEKKPPDPVEPKPAPKPEPEASTSTPAPKPEPEPDPEPKQLPKLLELGADKCVPCKMMKPILEELEKDYKGKLEVVFIDVRKNQSVGQQYGIRSIPTQIFFDTTGKEFFRHTGFYPKEDILKKFREHGIEL